MKISNPYVFKLFSLVIFILGSSLLLLAQRDSLEIRAYEKAASKLVCLKNEGKLIPLKGLDTLRIGTIDLWPEGQAGLNEMLKKYTKIGQAPLPWGENADFYAQKAARDFDLLVVAANGAVAYGEASEIIAEVNEFYARLGKETRLILVVFNSGSLWQKIPLQAHADVILYLEENTYWHQSLAAQLIFGAIGTKAVLKQDLSTHFVAGSGLKVEACQRLGFAPPGMAGLDADLLNDSIAAIVKDGIRQGAYPGAQVLVAKGGKVVYHEAFGYHTYEKEKPVKTSDIYDFASVTKTTSALPALMKLYGEGKFDIDAPLAAYMPEFKKSNKAMLSFRSMLAHNARLRPWIPYWRSTLKGNAKYPWKKRWDNEGINNFKFKRKTFSRDSSEEFSIMLTEGLWQHKDYKEKIYEAIRKSPLREKKEYIYSGLLFYLLPEIVADISGEDYESYLKQSFFEPLGAFTLTYNPLRFYPKQRIIPTERDTFFRMVQIHGKVHDEGAAMMDGVSANAGLFGSANDLAKLAQMYLNKGAYGGQRFISEEAVEEFTRCQYCEEGNRRGLGFDKPVIEYTPEASYVAKDASPDSYGHSGYTGTFYWVDPQHELIVIFFSNRVYPTRLNRKLYTLDIRPRIHQVVYDSCNSE